MRKDSEYLIRYILWIKVFIISILCWCFINMEFIDNRRFYLITEQMRKIMEFIEIYNLYSHSTDLCFHFFNKRFLCPFCCETTNLNDVLPLELIIEFQYCIESQFYLTCDLYNCISYEFMISISKFIQFRWKFFFYIHIWRHQ